MTLIYILALQFLLNDSAEMSNPNKLSSRHMVSSRGHSNKLWLVKCTTQYLLKNIFALFVLIFLFYGAQNISKIFPSTADIIFLKIFFGRKLLCQASLYLDTYILVPAIWQGKISRDCKWDYVPAIRIYFDLFLQLRNRRKRSR